MARIDSRPTNSRLPICRYRRTLCVLPTSPYAPISVARRSSLLLCLKSFVSFTFWGQSCILWVNLSEQLLSFHCRSSIPYVVSIVSQRSRNSRCRRRGALSACSSHIVTSLSWSRLQTPRRSCPQMDFENPLFVVHAAKTL